MSDSLLVSGDTQKILHGILGVDTAEEESDTDSDSDRATADNSEKVEKKRRYFEKLARMIISDPAQYVYREARKLTTNLMNLVILPVDDIK